MNNVNKDFESSPRPNPGCEELLRNPESPWVEFVEGDDLAADKAAGDITLVFEG